MRSRVARLVLAAAVLSAGATTASAATELPAGSHQQLINRVLSRVAPGDRGRILRGFTLQITIPHGLGSPERANYTPTWRAGLAAQELALRLPGLRQLSIPGSGTDSFGRVEHPLGITNLDALTLREARQQLSANLQVLANGLPAFAHLRVHTTVVPLALATRQFAFDVNITVDRLGDLHRYYGDLALGPGTGLTERNAPIEGMAVYVHDAHGQHLGAWTDIRGQEGAINYGPGDGCFDVTLPFRDQRGHPPTDACHG